MPAQLSTVWLFLALAIICSARSLGQSEGSLETLSSFAIPYAQLVSRGFSRPVTSLAQSFVSGSEIAASVSTAFPVLVPRHVAWDVRALTIDVVVGRRESGSSSIFEFDWDASALLHNAPIVLSIYDDCAGLPCKDPIRTFRNITTTASNGDGMETERYDWGNVYRIGVFISRDPHVSGLRLDTSEVWVTYVAELPRFYTDPVFDQPYELRHWLPVWAGASAQTDLAIRDFGNVLGSGWTDWQPGHRLQFVIYEGIAYPTPGYALIGYVREPGDPHLNNTTHPLYPPTPPPSTPDSVIAQPGVGAGFIVLFVSLGICVLGTLFMLVFGLYRRRMRRIERRRGFNVGKGYRGIPDDGASLSVSSDGRFRMDSSQSTGAPMRQLADMDSASDDDDGDSLKEGDVLVSNINTQGSAGWD